MLQGERPSRDELLNEYADFTWNFGNKFFVQTKRFGNFIWSDPAYPGGDNTIVPFDGGYAAWLKVESIPFGRSKGTHRIGDYCGNDVSYYDPQ